MASPLCQSPLLSSREGSNSIHWQSHTKLPHYQPLLPTRTWSYVNASSGLPTRTWSDVNASSSRIGLDVTPYSGGLEGNTLHGRNGFPSKSSLHNHTSNVTSSEHKSHQRFKKYSKKRSLSFKENADNPKKLSKKDQNSFTCHVCHKSEIKHMKNHLFFGPTQCVKCGMKCEDCLTFMLVLRSISEKCKHSLVYSHNPVAFICARISHGYLNNGSSFADRLLQDFSKYMDNFKVLIGELPWSAAIQICDAYKVENFHEITTFNKNRRLGNAKYASPSRSVNLNSNNSGSGCDDAELLLSQNYDLLSLDQATEYVKVAQDPAAPPQSSSDNTDPAHLKSVHKTLPYPKVSSKSSQADLPKQKKLSKLNGLIEMPEDEYYLVKTEPIEECPMCYTVICPSKFNINTQSFLVTYICVQCELKIYFVVSPSVAIVTDELMNTMKRDITVKRTGSHKRKTKDMTLLPKPPNFGPGFVRAADFIK